MQSRCEWCLQDPLYIEYHDTEWGKPVHDDRTLFEMLILEGAQAGLSWLTILKKRNGYRAAFDNFDPELVAHYSEGKISELLLNPSIVRNKLKVNSAIKNAQHFLEIQKEFGSFDAYLWKYVDFQQVQGNWNTIQEIPVKNALSDLISKDLQKRGFKFVGSTIIFSYLLAIGVINGHIVTCFTGKS